MAAVKRSRTYSTSRAGPYKRTRTSPGSSAKNPIVIPDSQVRRVMNARVGGFMGIELKYRDSSRVGAVLQATSNASNGVHDPATRGLLNDIDQGDGPNQRDGRQVRLKNITVKGQIRIGPETGLSGPDNVPRIFIALVLDKQTNGVQMASESAFVNPSNVPNLCCDPFLNLETSQRFRILKTCHLGPKDFAGCHTMGTYPAGQLAENGLTIPFTMFADLKSLPVNYLGTTGTAANVADNSLHIVAWCNDVTTDPVLDYNCRIRFVG